MLPSLAMTTLPKETAGDGICKEVYCYYSTATTLLLLLLLLLLYCYYSTATAVCKEYYNYCSAATIQEFMIKERLIMGFMRDRGRRNSRAIQTVSRRIPTIPSLCVPVSALRTFTPVGVQGQCFLDVGRGKGGGEWLVHAMCVAFWCFPT